MNLFSTEHWELLSYVVTVVGLPFGIGVFIYEQRRERQNEEEEIYQQLSDEYANFLKLVLNHSDLQLFQKYDESRAFTPEQTERKLILFDILTSLFERAFILVYEERMDRQSKRLWGSWDDYIRWWCKRKDYRDALPELLEGEDPDFVAYMNHASSTMAQSNLATTVR